MGAVFGFILGLWAVGAILSAPYFWAKRVDRSLPGVARRFLALCYGFGWPYFLFKAFDDRQQASTRTATRDQLRRSILDDGPGVGSPPPATPRSSTIRDPFEHD